MVILFNTNLLHCYYWPSQYPKVQECVDKLYLSQDLGIRKPDTAIYRYVLEQVGATADGAVFFEDNADNIAAARQVGIRIVHVTDREVMSAFFA